MTEIKIVGNELWIISRKRARKVLGHNDIKVMNYKPDEGWSYPYEESNDFKKILDLAKSFIRFNFEIFICENETIEPNNLEGAFRYELYIRKKSEGNALGTYT